MFGHTISNSEYIRHNSAWQSSNLKRGSYKQGMSMWKKLAITATSMLLVCGIATAAYVYITQYM